MYRVIKNGYNKFTVIHGIKTGNVVRWYPTHKKFGSIESAQRFAAEAESGSQN